MKKFNVSIFSSFCISFSIYNMLNPSYYLQLIISSSGLYTLARIVVSVLLLAYTFLPEVRTYHTRLVMKGMGTALLLFGVATYISPTFFGTMGYIPVVDTLIFIEGGILATLLGMEMPVGKSRWVMAKSRRLLATLWASQSLAIPTQHIKMPHNSSRLAAKTAPRLIQATQ